MANVKTIFLLWLLTRPSCISDSWNWMFICVMHFNSTWVWKSGALWDEHVQYILSLFLTPVSVIKLFQNARVPLELSGSVILICCLFSNSSFVIGTLEIKLSWSQSVWGYVIVGSYLVERGNSSRGVAAEAIASLDSGDDALEVGAVQQLRELQQSVAQDEQLRRTDSTVALSVRELCRWKQIYWHAER